MSRKVKISLTLDGHLVETLDREAAATGRRNRSEVVQRVLEAWARSRRKVRLDQAIESYYLGMGEQEAEEDAAWARAAEETVTGYWEDR